MRLAERERAQLCACVDFWVKLAPGGGSRERETGHSLGSGLARQQTQHNIGTGRSGEHPVFWTWLGSFVSKPWIECLLVYALSYTCKTSVH